MIAAKKEGLKRVGGGATCQEVSPCYLKLLYATWVASRMMMSFTSLIGRGVDFLDQSL
jgi:hypothetical protein